MADPETGLNTATFDDIPDLILMMEEFFAMFDYPFDRSLRTGQLHEIISKPEWAQLMVLNINTVTAGYLLLSFTYSFEFGGRIGYIDEFYLNPSFRGRGLGKIILKALKKEMKNTGIVSLRLEVEQSNKQAIKLYESEGFIIHDSRWLMTFRP